MALDVGKALKSKTLVVGVLSMSLLMSASNAVSGTIPAMKEAFSDYSAEIGRASCRERVFRAV